MNSTSKSMLYVLLILVFSCKSESREVKAKKLIKDHLFETLHDFKSYEPVKFGTLDSSFTTVYDDSRYRLDKIKFDSLLLESKKMTDKAQTYLGLSSYTRLTSYYLEEAKRINAQASLLVNRLDSLSSTFKPAFNGWSMTHSYRAKSLSGNFGIGHYRYYFDKDLDTLRENTDIGAADNHENLSEND